MDIIVDTREQLPLWTRCIRFKLEVGDYSTLRLRKIFCIERKSLADLYGTITKGHFRFRGEHLRAKKHGIQLVVYVEGTKKQFEAKAWPGGKHRIIPGTTLIKIAEGIQRSWGIEFVWCSSREQCKRKIAARLKVEEAKLPKERKKAISS